MGDLAIMIVLREWINHRTDIIELFFTGLYFHQQQRGCFPGEKGRRPGWCGRQEGHPTEGLCTPGPSWFHHSPDRSRICRPGPGCDREGPEGFGRAGQGFRSTRQDLHPTATLVVPYETTDNKFC